MLLSILAALFAIVSLTYFFKRGLHGRRKCPNEKNKVPGLNKTDKILGNLPDMVKAGSLPNFLKELHDNYGPIASFWHKDVFTVSLGDQKYYKITEKMFDRHPALFEFALPLISSKSMQFLNGDFGRNRYKLLSQPFGFAGCAQALEQMNRIVKEDISEWKDGEQVELHESMMKIAIDIITKTNFGSHFDDKLNGESLNDGYSKVIDDLDDALLGLWSFGQGEAREKDFEKNLENFKLEIKRIVQARIAKKNAGDYDLAPFLDVVLDNIDDEEDIIYQAITFMVAGFHTSGTYMTWLFYNMGLYPEIQDKVREEIQKHLEGKGLRDMKDIEKLTYTKCVMDETLRHMKVATFSERQAEKDVEIDGYLIPKGSQILNSLCLTLDDKRAFETQMHLTLRTLKNDEIKDLHSAPLDLELENVLDIGERSLTVYSSLLKFIFLDLPMWRQL
eukprot:TRINITY_DN3652_c0_g1_i2.p1 TRINITY_DN3652_c0_g1~~TRINITY_DN3652_c0_g1_i2.p1  ORF type:complete len:447 (+),score=111.64 TRINITY_DN3652_c0_g1_i2:82-1422(+)